MHASSIFIKLICQSAGALPQSGLTVRQENKVFSKLPKSSHNFIEASCARGKTFLRKAVHLLRRSTFGACNEA